MSYNSSFDFPNAGQIDTGTNVTGWRTTRGPSRYIYHRATDYQRRIAISGRPFRQTWETFDRVELGWRGLRMTPGDQREQIQFGGFQALHGWDQRGGAWSFRLRERKGRESWASSSVSVGSQLINLMRDGSSHSEGTYREISNLYADDWQVGDRVWIIGDSDFRRQFGIYNTWEVRTLTNIIVQTSNIVIEFDLPLIFQVYRLDRILHEGYFPSCQMIDQEASPVRERDAGRGPYLYDVRFDFQSVVVPGYPGVPRFE